jgi:hypothetical protein
LPAKHLAELWALDLASGEDFLPDMRDAAQGRLKAFRTFRSMRIAFLIGCCDHCVSLNKKPLVKMNKKPLVGIYYWTWFDCAQGGPDNKCDPLNQNHGDVGIGWMGYDANCGKLFPFSSGSVASPGVLTRSLCFWNGGDGLCYSSLDPQTATTHATFLDELDVDFVVYDITNRSKSMFPAWEYTGALNAMDGFRNYRDYAGKDIRSVFMLSLSADFGDGIEKFAWEDTGIGENGTPKAGEWIRRHIEDIGRHYEAAPDSFLLVFGKPLLLIYVSEGRNVMKMDGKSPAFHGPEGLIPSITDFDCQVTYQGSTISIHKVFTIRYAIVARDGAKDFESISHQIWPFTAFAENRLTGSFSQFSEVGYATLLAPSVGMGRDPLLFNALVDIAAQRDKQFLLIRGWNEFSTGGDEPIPNAYTIEPNTELYKHDGSPDGDAYYYFHEVKRRLARLLCVNRQTGTVMVADSNGSNVGHGPFGGVDNQKWVLRSTGDGYYWIRNVGMGTYLDIDDSGINVIHSLRNPDRIEQQWNLIPLDDPRQYKIANRAREAWILEGDPNGTNVQIGLNAGNAYQQWGLDPIHIF